MRTIYQAALQDLDQLSVLFEQYRLFYKKSPDLAKAADFIKSRLENKDSVIFVASEAGRLMGFVQLYPAFSSTVMQKMWILNDLFVAPEFRSLKIGCELMCAAKQHAIVTQSHSLKLCTAMDNHQAQTLYQKLGYKKITIFEHYTLLID